MERNLPTTLSPVSVSRWRRGDQARRALRNSFRLHLLSLLLCFFLSSSSHEDSGHAKPGEFLSLLHFLSSSETSFFHLKGAVGGDVPRQRRVLERGRDAKTENSSSKDGHERSVKDDKEERTEGRKREQVMEKHLFDPSVYTPEVLQVSSEEPLRFMFGSCNLQPTGGEWQVDEEDRLMWSFLSKRKPKLFAWLGDTVYAHNYRHFTLSNSIRWRWNRLTWRELRQRRQEVSRAFHKPAPLEEMREAFYNQTHSTPYQQFLKTGVKIVATYDDHDLGADNPSKSHPLKYEARDLVLDFFNVDKDSPRRSVYWDGMYSSYKLQVDRDLSFRFILLDARFNRDSWKHLPHGDILGEQQWRWLEKELEKSREDRDAVTFIASSIQILPSPFVSTEAWAYFPTARRRLLDLVMNSGVDMPVFLSGDVHFSEMTGVLCRPVRLLPSSHEPHKRRRTSSSLHHSDKENRRKASPIHGEKDSERRDSFLSASSSSFSPLRFSDVSSGQCRVLSPWQEISLLLSQLEGEKNLMVTKEKKSRYPFSSEGEAGNPHSEESPSSLTAQEGEEKSELGRREEDNEERGFQRGEQDEEDEEEEMRGHHHSSLFSSLFPKAVRSSLEDEDDSSPSGRRRTTSWNPPGLLERLFPSISFLSSYVFMYLFGPSISTSFSLLSTSFPHHLLDLYLHGESEEQAGAEEETTRQLLKKKKLRELSASYRRYHERRNRTHGEETKDEEESEGEGEDDLAKKSKKTKKQSLPMAEREEEFVLEEENARASQKDRTSDNGEDQDQRRQRGAGSSSGDRGRLEDEKEEARDEDERERREQQRQTGEDLLSSRDEDEDLDWVELREFTSSGLTHGIEETFVQATTLANLAEYGLKKLFPRTATVKDDFYGDRLVYTHRNVAEIQVLRNPLFHLSSSSPSVASTASSTSTTKEEETLRASEQKVVSSSSETSSSLPSFKEEDREEFSHLLSQLENLSPSTLVDHCEMSEDDKLFCSDPSRLCGELIDESQVSKEKMRTKKKEEETEKGEVQQGREEKGQEEKEERVEKRPKKDETRLKTSPWRKAVEFFKASSNRFDFLVVLLQRFLELHAVAGEKAKENGEAREGMKEEENKKKEDMDLRVGFEGSREHETHNKRKLNIPPRSSWGACDSRKSGRIDREEERSLQSTIFCWKDPDEDEDNKGREQEKRNEENEEGEKRKDVKGKFEPSHEGGTKSEIGNGDISPGVHTPESHRSNNRDNKGNVEYSNRPQSPHYPLLQDAKFFSLLFSVEELLQRTLIGMAEDFSREKFHRDKGREEKEEEREEGGLLSSAWSESIHNYCSWISSDSRQAVSSLLKYLEDQKEEKERSVNRKQQGRSRRQYELREEDKEYTSHHHEDFSNSLKFLQFRDLLSRTLQDQFCRKLLVSRRSSSAASEEKTSRKAEETMENKEKRGKNKKNEGGKTGENVGIEKHQGVLREEEEEEKGDNRHAFFSISVRSFLMAIEQGVAHQASHEERGLTGESSSSLKSYFSFFYKNKSLVSCRRRIRDLYEILHSRLWLAIRIFALPFGDLVLESFLSPYQFQSKRHKLLSQLQDKARLYASPRDRRRGAGSRSSVSPSSSIEDQNEDGRERNEGRESGRIDGAIGWPRRSYMDDEYMRRARWICIPLRGQDHSLMYVALSLLVFFLSFLCFTYLCFHSCWTCCCRRRRKRSRKGTNPTTIETGGRTNRQVLLVKNVAKKLD